eukprot:3276427-Pyramimonas_sp.AAC.1
MGYILSLLRAATPTGEGEAAEGEENGDENAEDGEAPEEDAEPPAPPSPEPMAAPMTPPKPEFHLFMSNTHIPDEMGNFPTMYFLKPQAGMVVEEEEIDKIIDFGLLSEGPQLCELEVLLNQLYIPMLQHTDSGVGDSFTGLGVQTNEMLSNLHKFSSQVSHAIQQLTGDIHLNIPNISLENLDKASEDYDVVNLLESALAEWTAVLSSAIQRETEKVTAPEKGPLAEINYWRDRNAALSSLYEQLNLPNVRRMLSVVEVGSSDTNLLAAFKSQ